MEEALFSELKASLAEAVAIASGERAASRVFRVEGEDVRRIRERAGLSQSELAALMRVSVRTLQNWEQGHRRPTGPAEALIRIFDRDPRAAVQALRNPA